jgi:hypothetical protein
VGGRQQQGSQQVVQQNEAEFPHTATACMSSANHAQAKPATAKFTQHAAAATAVTSWLSMQQAAGTGRHYKQQVPEAVCGGKPVQCSHLKPDQVCVWCIGQAASNGRLNATLDLEEALRGAATCSRKQTASRQGQ